METAGGSGTAGQNVDFTKLYVRDPHRRAFVSGASMKAVNKSDKSIVSLAFHLFRSCRNLFEPVPGTRET